MTEVWFRNPHNYIRELVEAGGTNIVWDRGMLMKRRIDPWKHAEAYFAGRSDWKLLIIGTQGSPLYTPDSQKTPVAVYPTWDGTNEQLELLEEMMANPIGDDADACNDPSVPDEERPVAGQEHVVIVTDLPNLLHGQGRALIRKIKELQEDYPECKVFIHGTYSWRICFGLGFGAADVDPRTNASKGKVTLPSGKEMIAERTMQVPQWVTILGMKPIDLTREPRNRCIYNVKSALWAGEHFMENIAFKSAGTAKVDTTSPSAAVVPQTTKSVSQSHFSGPPRPYQPGDKINCDTCSVQNSCKYYRQGSVCSVPGSEPAELARQFKTRDADQIIDGLGTLMALGARRLDQGVASEQMYGELDPEVTKMIGQLFQQGEKLAKLIDPTLRQGPQVQVNVGAGANAAALTAATPNQMIGGIVRELESRGIPRDQITPRMIENLISEMAGGDNAPRAIQGEVLAKRDE